MYQLTEKLSQNELRILKAVYETGPVSRVRVARGLHLTRAAVSVNIKRLKEMGLIIEVGKGNSSERRGRREVLLTVNPSFGFIISIHIELSAATFAISDLGGSILKLEKITFEIGDLPEQVLPPLTKGIKRLMDEVELDTSKLFGIGVALPGIISYPDGDLGEQTLIGWESFPLREYLSKELEGNVYIDNDVKALTLGEFQFGTSRHISNLVCLWLANGIGAGFMVDGRLMRGATSSAGEVGFNEFFPEIPIKKSIFIDGQPKFWGDILSVSNILNSIKRGIAEGWTTTLTTNATTADFVRGVEQQDPLATFIFRLLGQIVGTVCKNIVYTFNPQTLILSGPLFNQLPMLVDEVRSSTKNNNLKKPLEEVEFKTSVLDKNGMLVGCVALVLEHLFRTAEQRSMYSHPNLTAKLLD